MPVFKISIWLFMVLPFCLCGQITKPVRPFEKIAFFDFSPEWHATCQDYFYKEPGGDGYNQFKFPEYVNMVYDEEAVYIIYYNKSSKPHDYGTYIEKRSLETGALLWQTYYGLPVSLYQEFGVKMKMNKNNQLEIYSLIKSTPFEVIDHVKPLILSKRLVNKDNGSFITLVHQAIENTYAFPYAFNNDEYGSDFHFIEDSILYYKQIVENAKLVHSTQLVNEGSLITNTTTYKLPLTYYHTLNKMFEVGENKYLLVEKKFNPDQLFLRYVDKKLNVLSEHLCPDISSNLFYAGITQIDKATGNILIQNAIIPQNPFDTIQMEVIILDKEANLIKKVLIPKEYSYVFGVLEWVDDLWVIGSNFQLTDNNRLVCYMDILKENDVNKLEVVKRYTPIDSLRYPVRYRFEHLDAQKGLMLWTEEAFYEKSVGFATDLSAKARSVLLLDKAAFYQDAVQVEEVSSPSLVVYPNPASDRLHIKHEGMTISNINIVDITGQKYPCDITKDIVETSIYTGALRNGFYILNIEEKGGKLYNSKVIIQH